ncbi:HSPB1-associated protein 1 [Patella vulgata]|uniref:HSPB1-associated protein 1 n=1 Tax=Patella vulgata TaxID=6465 RepID=UPI00217F564B|nr:HSPB1-associated protein 1 [Patella vulgata]XP_050404951.1 HSPB1-associated protein 1 [Patella vulgata]XP_050404952.1 HSPB1-associated protein 1 [Patella vulgata]XP_050404953.1 HSPB1-associated protein 1 [Patella vulgata]XP_050404954.1 HSPB1-associated protein 1 [Patella vulgata]XP_050404955.1 HSPB1-associated protein 1 [Patella vulgata]XP_050404956.1 HSPB1-associated protein 1 [Patella vulgata]
MDFKDFISQCNGPLIFNNNLNCPAIEWTPQVLTDLLNNKMMKCKIGPKNPEDTVFETDCLYLNVTLRDFIDWCEGNVKESNSLAEIDKEKFFCYVDYKYMPDLFEDSPDLLESVSWDSFGLCTRNGKDCTIWIGSEGAFTPCHYDTYGFNLVAQIYGSKRWYLFPPSATKYMYATRIPYEESSVFSEINIKQPDILYYTEFQKSQPYIVTLEPGQVLYVPKHWWHYVECLNTTVSINTWVEMKDDNETRVKEAITRVLISSLVSDFQECFDTQHWINPNEEVKNCPVNIGYLHKAVTDLKLSTTHGNQEMDNFKLFCDKFKSLQVTPSSDNMSESLDLNRKRPKMSSEYLKNTDSSETTNNSVNIKQVQSYSFKEYLEFIGYSQVKLPGNEQQEIKADLCLKSETDLTKHLVKSILKPEVINILTKSFLDFK